MQKTILITGATDGIGFETAKMLANSGHHVLVHGRNPAKLEKVKEVLAAIPGEGRVDHYVADLSRLGDVEKLANDIAEKHASLDVLINNAGVYNAPDPVTADGLEIRFAVNTVAPYLLTRRLLPLLNSSGRVINLSSAAQSPVDPKALKGPVGLSEGAAYAQP